MPELPMLPSEPTCPAALPIAGACGSQRGVVCRIMQRDSEEDRGLRMNPRQLEVVREAEGGVYLNLKADPSTVVMFCHGDGIPVVTNDDGQGRPSYTFCPVWQAKRDRELARQSGLYDDTEPEPVAMGVSTTDAPDPWAQARRDVELFG